jgi:alcohol dehydrogenase
MDFVLRLRRDLGIPHTLDKIGVDDARFAEMAKMAVVDPTAGGNPRTLTEGDALDLYDRALNGRLG